MRDKIQVSPASENRLKAEKKLKKKRTKWNVSVGPKFNQLCFVRNAKKNTKMQYHKFWNEEICFASSAADPNTQSQRHSIIILNAHDLGVCIWECGIAPHETSISRFSFFSSLAFSLSFRLIIAFKEFIYAINAVIKP